MADQSSGVKTARISDVVDDIAGERLSPVQWMRDGAVRRGNEITRCCHRASFLILRESHHTSFHAIWERTSPDPGSQGEHM